MDDSNNDIAITVKGISKYFSPSAGQQTIKQLVTGIFKPNNTKKGGYWALNDINFEVKKGEFFGIVGRNGSGKSTLLKLIAGVYNPTKGHIKVNGKLVPFIELGVGFNPELSGRDNVFLNGALLGFSRKEMEAMYDEIVDFAELKDHMDVKLKNFSSGMQVRLAFSIAIRAKADILLIDEVLAVGDAAFQQKCFSYFDKLKMESRTVVFITHDMGSFEKYCDRGLIIQDGNVARIGSPHIISAKYKLINITKQKSNTKEISKKLDNLIEGVSINGKSEAIFSKNTDAVVEFTVRPAKEDYVAGISIRRSDGVFVAFHGSNKETKFINSKMNAPTKFKYTFSSVQLLRGAYTVDIALYNKGGAYLDLKSDTCCFAIDSDDEFKGGVVKLIGSWSAKTT